MMKVKQMMFLALCLQLEAAAAGELELSAALAAESLWFCLGACVRRFEKVMLETMDLDLTVVWV